MDDNAYSPRPVAAWFLPAAIASLLFMAFGCVMYLMQVLGTPTELDQIKAMEVTPAWVTGANGLAVWVGLAGAVALVLRKRIAELLLAVSLLGVVVMIVGLLVTPLREVASAGDLVVAIVVAAVTWTIFWFARHSRQRGWLV